MKYCCQDNLVLLTDRISAEIYSFPVAPHLLGCAHRLGIQNYENNLNHICIPNSKTSGKPMGDHKNKNSFILFFICGNIWTSVYKINNKYCHNKP